MSKAAVWPYFGVLFPDFLAVTGVKEERSEIRRADMAAGSNYVSKD
jgi:hypothetical protein